MYTPTSVDADLQSLYRFAIWNQDSEHPEFAVDEYVDGEIYRLWSAPLEALMPFIKPERYSDERAAVGFGVMRPKTIQVDLFAPNRHIHIERFLYIGYFDPHRPALSFHVLSYGKQGADAPGLLLKVDLERGDYNGILVMEEQARYASGEKLGIAPLNFISGNYSQADVLPVCETLLRK